MTFAALSDAVPSSKATRPIVRIRNIEMEYRSTSGNARILDDLVLDVMPGAIVGVVGESGSGKSTLALAIARLTAPTLQLVGGDIEVDGRSVFSLNGRELRELRRSRMGFVFQNPMVALDPTKRVRDQILFAMDEPSMEGVDALLRSAGLTEVERVAASYPHELSGGMAQRAVIAAAIARHPEILIADEPTASLDATVRHQVLETLVGLCRSLNSSMLLLSHELRVVSAVCDVVAVVYAGRVVEFGPAGEVFGTPRHPYTKALLSASPGAERPGAVLSPIPGLPPIMSGRVRGCAFSERCPTAREICTTDRPPIRGDRVHRSLCHNVGGEEVTADV